MKKTFKLGVYFLLIYVLAACTSSNTQEIETQSTEIILATTTSTQDSGLLDVLIPMFEKQHNIKVKTIAVGTGQALAMGEKGEADVLLTHAPSSEEKLVQNQDVIYRKRVMYNDFILIGPAADPAGINGRDVKTALTKIFETRSTFVSRGDDSGTHKMELNLWDVAELEPGTQSWYIETGQGMGSTLQLSAEKDGYLLTDRATYLAHAKNMEHMAVLVEGDQKLLNIYHVMQVNQDKYSFVNGEAGKLFVEFMVSEEAQTIIKNFGVEQYGQPLFFQFTE
ncbi:substrate-binding domain-containing protein [Anaerobacillus sp. CMMVII]|uniref:substrate-binding domain-containing protein n=1 Tax=Anaerobacillus sp. CMMVII TaxID=2755588 RepID=UPI0021B81037|nr:substrate-binding domain-containing protein [Anaerobacillus sp. CMMVII]MCT8139406.1 substrate-binding domain-containing protein [Anaerobacillus sp. CMMVII]